MCRILVSDGAKRVLLPIRLSAAGWRTRVPSRNQRNTSTAWQQLIRLEPRCPQWNPAYCEQRPMVGLDEILDRVTFGRLVTVVGSTMAGQLSLEIVAVSVADLPATTPALGWLQHASRPEVASLARTAERIAADRKDPFEAVTAA